MESNEEIIEGLIECMVFKLGGTDYAVELGKIKEILTYPDLITVIPNTSKSMKGLINLRGEVVPIIDLREYFNIEKMITKEKPIVIAILTEDKRMIGIVVDFVNEVKKIDLSHINKVGELGFSLPSENIKGYVKTGDNEMLVLMNIEKVLSKSNIQKL